MGYYTAVNKQSVVSDVWNTPLNFKKKKEHSIEVWNVMQTASVWCPEGNVCNYVKSLEDKQGLACTNATSPGRWEPGWRRVGREGKIPNKCTFYILGFEPYEDISSSRKIALSFNGKYSRTIIFLIGDTVFTLMQPKVIFLYFQPLPHIETLAK